MKDRGATAPPLSGLAWEKLLDSSVGEARAQMGVMSVVVTVASVPIGLGVSAVRRWTGARKTTSSAG